MGLNSINIKTGVIVTLTVALVLALAWSSRPLAGDVDADIQDAILSQIEAFANEDEVQAWEYASEGIKRRFRTSEGFLTMVREAYPAVHSATSIEFAERVPHDGFDIQVVRLQGPEGKRWDAYYRMELAEGAWKIAGVRLQPADLGI